MSRDECVSLMLAKHAMPHHSQIVVSQSRHPLILCISIKHGSKFFAPEVFGGDASNILGGGQPLLLALAIAQQARNASQAPSIVV